MAIDVRTPLGIKAEVSDIYWNDKGEFATVQRDTSHPDWDGQPVVAHVRWPEGKFLTGDTYRAEELTIVWHNCPDSVVAELVKAGFQFDL